MKYFLKILGISLFLAASYTLKDQHANVFEALKYINEQKFTDENQINVI